MSIEEKIEKLTAAVEANTAIQSDVLAALKSGGSAKATTAAKGGATKPATEKKTPPKPKGVTVDEISKRFGAYMSAEDDDEKAAAVANVKALTEHFGVARVSLVPDEQRKELLDMLDAFERGEDPLAEEGGDDDDGGAALV